jgi:DNA polymerase-4
VTRTIIHADLDAFYASVEQFDRPDLRGRPVVVGGSPETRGVVAAASYEARYFGVRSAMPMSKALRLCPQAARVSPRFDRYGEISRRIMAIFRSTTPLVEPLSLDEAFLDVTEQAKRYGDPRGLAQSLKREVKTSTGLTLSIGVGANKTVAKIASDMEKPDGLVLVPPGREAAFLAPLPVRALWGIGPKAESALVSVRIQTAGDLAGAEPALMERLLGSRGSELQRMAQGTDDRPVEPVRERKSVGAETTFPKDLPGGEELSAHLHRIAVSVSRRLAKEGVKARTVALKLRYSDFRTITRQTSRSEPTDDPGEITRTAEAMLHRTKLAEDRFRLLGIHCSNLTTEEEAQLSLWGAGGPAG